LLKAITLINTFDNIKDVMRLIISRGKIACAFGMEASSRKLKQMNAEMQSHRKILTNRGEILNPMRAYISKALLLILFVLLEVSFEVINLGVSTNVRFDRVATTSASKDLQVYYFEGTSRSTKRIRSNALEM